MENELARITRWRDLADQYRLKAACALSSGSRLAFNALAESADGVADSMEAGTLVPNLTRGSLKPEGTT
jgi:hypothetical protein